MVIFAEKIKGEYLRNDVGIVRHNKQRKKNNEVAKDDSHTIKFLESSVVETFRGTDGIQMILRQGKA